MCDFLYLFHSFPYVCFTGATFDQNKKLNTAILEYAVKTANAQILSGTGIEIKHTVELIDYGNEFMASESVCHLLDVWSLDFFLHNSRILYDFHWKFELFFLTKFRIIDKNLNVFLNFCGNHKLPISNNCEFHPK